MAGLTHRPSAALALRSGASTPPSQGQSATFACLLEGAVVVVRRYEEPIEVRAAKDGTWPDSQPGGGYQGAHAAQATQQQETPDAFVWRGRLYVVREVIDHWQERRAWWRDALEESADEGDVGPGRPGADHERQVWRVAASPGQMAATGVYDLGSDGGPGRWLLLRAQD